MMESESTKSVHRSLKSLIKLEMIKILGVKGLKCCQWRVSLHCIYILTLILNRFNIFYSICFTKHSQFFPHVLFFFYCPFFSFSQIWMRPEHVRPKIFQAVSFCLTFEIYNRSVTYLNAPQNSKRLYKAIPMQFSYIDIKA